MSRLAPLELIVIAGPTASGKSALAVELALRMDAEILSADSQQVYRHFDIGTAKPTLEEQRGVRHHLISVVDPLEPFSAGQYQRLADEAIREIHGRGKPVLVVGGTGLYLRVLLHGVMHAPPVDATLRASLHQEAAQLGADALHRRLAQVDPVTAKMHPPSDVLRVVRALELFLQTGRAASVLRDEHRFGEARYRHRFYVLQPAREDLYRAIDARTRGLYESGLVEETRRLVEAGFRHTAPMKSVGYRQALDVVEGRTLEGEAEASTAQQTRRYAKRQGTWFRGQANAQVLTPPYEEALEAVTRRL